MNKITDIIVSRQVLWMYIVQYMENHTAMAHQALLNELKVMTVRLFLGHILTLKDKRAVHAYQVRSSWVQGTTHTRIAFPAT